MADACERAKIEPPANFHCLRHTYASHAVMAGAPLIVVAKNLGQPIPGWSRSTTATFRELRRRRDPCCRAAIGRRRAGRRSARSGPVDDRAVPVNLYDGSGDH